jgi:hypothetical protein
VIIQTHSYEIGTKLHVKMNFSMHPTLMRPWAIRFDGLLSKNRHIPKFQGYIRFIDGFLSSRFTSPKTTMPTCYHSIGIKKCIV